MLRSTANKAIPTLFGAFLLMIFALYNGFPIVSEDTTTYLDSAFLLKVPDERPVFYGLFLRLSSLGASLWLSVFVQSLILSYVLIKLVRNLLPGVDSFKIGGLLLVISLGTIAIWYAGQIMPDIFTPILFLAAANILLFRHSKTTFLLLFAILGLAILTHFSHYIISTLFFGGLLLVTFFHEGLRRFRKRAIYALFTTAAAWLLLYSSNYMTGKGFTSSRVSHVFLMGKLAESGVLKTYLDKACPINNYTVCQYKDQLPPVAWEYVWDQQHSPVFKAGGWEATKDEYTHIIHDIASRPKYWPFLAYKSVEATARQVILTNIDEGEERPWIKFEREHPLYQAIERNFPHEINEFAVSKQNIKTLNIKFYDDVYVLVILISSFLVLMIAQPVLTQKFQALYLLLFAFILLNAFATATFGNVLSRLNSRAIWLLPAVNIVVLYQAFLFRLKPVTSDATMGGQLHG